MMALRSTRLSTLLLTIMMLMSIVVGCKAARKLTRAAYIIGPTNEIVAVEPKMTKDIPPAHLRSVVLLVLNLDEKHRKFCSGTLIDPAADATQLRVLTSHHCFTDEVDDNNAVPREFVPQACQKTTVIFGFFKGMTQNRALGLCAENSLMSDYEADIAVFTLKANPDPVYQPAKLWAGTDIPMNRAARIIHFPTIDASDPNANQNLVYEKAVGISLPVAQITDKDCFTKGPFAESDWHLDRALGFGVKHTCDQKKGSSGSALFDVETNTILGVNWGGIIINDQFNNQETFNVATRADYVRAFLAGDTTKEKDKVAMGSQFPEDQGQTKRAGERMQRVLSGTACGTIGSMADGSTLPFIAQLLFLTPALWVFRRRSK